MEQRDDAAIDVLERRWQALPLATGGTVHRLVRRIAEGVHETPAAVQISTAHGVIGDRWSRRERDRDRDAQVTLIERRVLATLVDDPARWHLCGDNIIVDLDLSEAGLPVGGRLRAGDVVLQLSAKPHAGCDVFRARFGDAALRWINARERRPRRMRGIHARVLQGGTVRVGDRFVRA